MQSIESQSAGLPEEGLVQIQLRIEYFDITGQKHCWNLTVRALEVDEVKAWEIAVTTLDRLFSTVISATLLERLKPLYVLDKERNYQLKYQIHNPHYINFKYIKRHINEANFLMSYTWWLYWLSIAREAAFHASAAVGTRSSGPVQ